MHREIKTYTCNDCQTQYGDNVIIFTDILEYSLKQKRFIQFSWARRKSIKTLVAG